MSLNNALLNAIGRYGPMVNRLARSQYGISGQALLAKLTQGESGGRANAVSSADARSYTQFTPGTRAVVMQKFGIDPWAGPDQAEHAAALHLLGRVTGNPGLAGYNPGGGQSYVDYILGQKVGPFGGASRPSGGTRPGNATQTTISGSVTPGAVSGGGFNPGSPPDLTGLLAQAPQQPVFQTPRPVTQGLKNLRLSVQPPQVPQLEQPQSTGPDLTSLLSAGQSLPSASVGAPKTQITRTQQQVAAKGTAAKGGVAHFDGKPVAGWIAPILQYARQHGWQGSVSSGYRTVAEQRHIYNSGVRPAAKPGQSNHNFTAFPGGAVDVTNAQQLASIIQRSPFAGKLVWAGGKDPVHFSHPHNGGY